MDPVFPRARLAPPARSRRFLARTAALLTVALGAACHDGPAAPKTGEIDVTIEGLPVGTQGLVTVVGPVQTNFSRAVGNSAKLPALPPGTYVVRSEPVVVNGARYVPVVATQNITVKGSRAPLVARVSYVLVSGALTVTIDGVPTGGTPLVVVTGPAGFSRRLAATETILGIDPGAYTIHAGDIAAAGHTWGATAPSQQVGVPISTTPVTASVTYAIATGAIAVEPSGLPAGTTAQLQLTGPGGSSRGLTSDQVITNLQPGPYTLTATAVTTGGRMYTPSPVAQMLAVTPSATPVVAKVDFTPGPYTGINLTVDGLHLTQAVQSYANAVPLVAGRDAFLRVFAKSDLPNAERPDVRVRFYLNGALVHTTTIPATPAGVPTMISEGTLASSWNVTVPAALVQPGLAVLAEVDPANAVTESNESDNLFPVSGAPLPITVESVPPLAVRFVPVTQNATGLTGNVGAPNLAQFLAHTKKVFPLKDVHADVRQPFTTSTPALQSNDGNGAWTQLLSEINALRIADGSQAYYVGVVRVGYSSGTAGYGFVPGRASVVWDYLPSAASITAHELGHNFSLQHAPCGGAASPDPRYPYPAGEIGVYGYDFATATLKPPTAADLMGYCGFTWISDYNYRAVLDYRAFTPNATIASTSLGGARSLARATVPSLDAAPTRSLLVWGRIVGGAPILEPAFALTTRPALPSTPGPYRLEARDAAGNVLLAYTFAGDEVADVPGHSVRQFAFAIPVDAATESRIATLQVTNDRTGTSARVLDGATGPRMALLRDASTGEILGFSRDAGIATRRAGVTVEVSRFVGGR